MLCSQFADSSNSYTKTWFINRFKHSFASFKKLITRENCWNLLKGTTVMHHAVLHFLYNYSKCVHCFPVVQHRLMNTFIRQQDKKTDRETDIYNENYKLQSVINIWQETQCDSPSSNMLRQGNWLHTIICSMHQIYTKQIGQDIFWQVQMSIKFNFMQHLQMFNIIQCAVLSNFHF